MHTKKYIDNLFKNITMACEVSLISLTAEDISNFKLGSKKNKDYTPKEDVDKLKEDGSASQDEKTLNEDTKSKTDKTSIVVEPPKKKRKFCTDKIDVLKSVFSGRIENRTFKSELNSSLESIKEIASTSTEVPIVIDSIKSIESANSSAINVRPMIKFMDLKKIMNEDTHINWTKTLKINKPSISENESFLNIKVKEVKHPLNDNKYVRRNLIKIEKLYVTYFSKSVQDTIVAIANILNVISMSNNYHEARINKASKKKSELKKLKESYDADQLHSRHKTILEKKLENNFLDVILSLEGPDFDTVFKMLFLSVSSVFHVLDQAKIKKCKIYERFVFILGESLKNSEHVHRKYFSLFQSKEFRSDCIQLFSLVTEGPNIDPGVTDRMPLFYISTVNSLECFQAVIDAVTSDSNEDLALLIDNATFQCYINSIFNDPVDSSIVQD